ncbi:MAG: hypothetical protein ACXWNZ_18080 [Vulcanimicrobiaceae bacterium]
MVITMLVLAALCCVRIAAVADSLPLTLKLWSTKDAQTITCSGKSWVEVPPGTLQREAVIAVLPGPNPLSNEQKVLACNDGLGNSAPIIGAVSQTTVAHPGQTVLQGVLRVIVLRAPSDAGTTSSIMFAVNTAAGDSAVMSRSGKGLIRVDHQLGIAVYPPSYQLGRVLESTIYTVQGAQKPSQPCTLTYVADNLDAAPKKVIHSQLDCATLMQQVDSNAIFAGEIPQQP